MHLLNCLSQILQLSIYFNILTFFAVFLWARQQLQTTALTSRLVSLFLCLTERKCIPASVSKFAVAAREICGLV